MNTRKDTKTSSINDNEVLVTRRKRGSTRVFSHMVNGSPVYREIRHNKIVEEKGRIVHRGPLLTYIQLEGHSGVVALWPHEFTTRPGFVEGTPAPIAIEQPATEVA